MIKKIGFACKFSEFHDKKGIISIPKYNTKTTTVAWLNRQSKTIAEAKLWELLKHNIEATRKLVEKVGTLNEELRMVRISSDVLPMYTHHDYKYFWNQTDVIAYAERNFSKIGCIARDNNIRLSFHPGQFCVLASDNEDVVTRSIEEFEYHADMAKWMGYGSSWHDHGFKINVHISGRKGPEGIRDALKRMSPEARNLITIENEEMSYGLDRCLSLSDVLPIVLDIHHHWINTGEYINSSDDRVKMVEDSWRGVRPTLHYSVSREDILTGHKRNIIPDYHSLIKEGHNRQKLRAHSNYYWNTACNQWALEFNDKFDIMCESKAKNLASFALHAYSKTL